MKKILLVSMWVLWKCFWWEAQKVFFGRNLKISWTGMRRRLWYRKTLPFLIYSLYKNIECRLRFAEAWNFLDVSFTHTLAFFFNNPLFIVILFPYNIIKKCSFLFCPLIFFLTVSSGMKLLVFCRFFLL